jgi:hypothetical protein
MFTWERPGSGWFCLNPLANPSSLEINIPGVGHGDPEALGAVSKVEWTFEPAGKKSVVVINQTTTRLSSSFISYVKRKD